MMTPETLAMIATLTAIIELHPVVDYAKDALDARDATYLAEVVNGCIKKIEDGRLAMSPNSPNPTVYCQDFVLGLWILGKQRQQQMQAEPPLQR